MVIPKFADDVTKDAVFQTVEQVIAANGLHVLYEDRQRPWGGFFAFIEADLARFIEKCYDGIEVDLSDGLPRQPKILIIEPGKRLSWQYHHRRAERWRVLAGPIDIVTQVEGAPENVQTLNVGDEINLEQGVRHRGVGLETWGVVAEIWQHTDPINPSNEEDIVRLQDDFART